MTWVVRILAAIGALALVLWIYALVTPEPTDELPRSVSDPDTAHFLESAAANLGAPAVPGNRVTALTNGDGIFPPMLDAIRGAERSITFLTYVYWTGPIADEFAGALADACGRGVETRVLLDAVGAAQMDDGLVARMRSAGCTVAWYRPLEWHTLRRANHRTHRRVLVVDGRVGFTGGVGIAEEWMGNAEDAEHWRDEHFRVEGPVVRHLQGAFSENWREATGEVLTGSALFPEIAPAGTAAVVPILGEPLGSVSRTALLYWLTLRRARERVRIWTPYFAPDPPLLAALLETARRGVSVEILLPDEKNDMRIVRWASQTYYDDLLEAGVRVYEYEASMMHAKIVTVDGRWSIVGTANFDNRSFERNHEIVLAVEDPVLTAELDAQWMTDLGAARRIGPRDLAERNVLERMRDRIVLLLREQI